jgi:hypothetical protein
MLSKGQRLKETERRDKILEEFRVPNQIINTDSVYSFLHSEPWHPLKMRGRGGFWVVEDKPIPVDSIFVRVEKNYLFETMSWFYDEFNHHRKEEIIPHAILRKMLAKAFDPTTQCSEPIVKWNISRMGEGWMTEGLYSANYNKFIEKRINESKGWQFYWLKRVFNDYDWTKRISFSVPVFDDDYNYALLIMKKPGFYYYSFALFKREKDGWKPFFVQSSKEPGYWGIPMYDFDEFWDYRKL